MGNCWEHFFWHIFWSPMANYVHPSYPCGYMATPFIFFVSIQYSMFYT
jgi:hypothetical protein